jgi:hypothetical protein
VGMPRLMDGRGIRAGRNGMDAAQAFIGWLSCAFRKSARGAIGERSPILPRSASLSMALILSAQPCEGL